MFYNKKPAFSAVSEILRPLLVFGSIDVTGEESSLSIYFNSGLLRDSHVDMLSSKETGPPSEILGEASMPLGALIGLLGAGRTASTLQGEERAAMLDIG